MKKTVIAMLFLVTVSMVGAQSYQYWVELFDQGDDPTFPGCYHGYETSQCTGLYATTVDACQPNGKLAEVFVTGYCGNINVKFYDCKVNCISRGYQTGKCVSIPLCSNGAGDIAESAWCSCT